MNLDSRAHGNGVHGKEIVLKPATALIPLVLIILAIPAVQGITLDINAPEAVTEGDLLSISFTAANGTNISQFIFKNNTLVGNSSYDWQTTSKDSGTYTFRFLANTSTDSEEQIKIIEVLDSPGKLTINNPLAGVIVNPEVRISATPNYPAAECQYSIAGTSDDISGNLIEGVDEWYKIVLLSTDKIYNLTVSCTGEETVAESAIFILDTTHPNIVSKKPEGSFTGNPIQLEVETNENSVCKYGPNDLSYENLENTFSQTGGTEHKQIVKIDVQSQLEYYVACQDNHGNSMQRSERIEFSANLKPSASILLADNDNAEELLKPGTYQVEIVTSEPVINPTLEYEFSNERVRKSIPVEGEGQHWEGFIAISEEIESDVGTFFFSASDLTDLTGTEITNGKIFLVDTDAPEAIENLELKIEGIDAEIAWYYEGEAVDDFYIYRDNKPEVDHLDKYAETPNSMFVDQNVLIGERYYYRVAAVDKAGNVGPLSDEKTILIEINSEKEIDPQALRNLDSAQDLLQKKIFDIEKNIARLTGETDRSKLEIIRELDLLKRANHAKNSISTFISEIEKLKLLGLNEGEASKRIEVFLESSDKQLQQVAENIVIIDSTRQDQVLLEEDLEEAINEVLIGIKMSSEDRQAYQEKMRNLQDITKINLEAISVQIGYMETLVPEDITLVKKQVIAEIPVDDALVVEIIPKEVARRDSEITFKEEPVVLNPDPIVKWESTGLTSKNIVYYVQKIVELSQVKKSRTVLLERPEVKKDSPGALFTGNAVSEPENIEENSVLSQVVFALGIIALLSLLVYYMAYVKEGKMHQARVIMPQHTARQAVKPRTNQHRAIHALQRWDIYKDLKRAHSYIDDVRNQEALELYKEVLDKLEKSKLEKNQLDSKIKINIEDNVNSLYRKIMLVAKINSAHKAVDAKNGRQLRQSLIDIKNTYSSLTSETELAKHARQSYSYFLNYMKNMDQEEFFNKLN